MNVCAPAERSGIRIKASAPRPEVRRIAVRGREVCRCGMDITISGIAVVPTEHPGMPDKANAPNSRRHKTLVKAIARNGPALFRNGMLTVDINVFARAERNGIR